MNNMNMGIWPIGALNQLFGIGSYIQLQICEK